MPSQDLHQFLSLLKQTSPHDKYWNISESLGKILSTYVYLRKPHSILEFGTSNGYSTLWMAAANVPCTIHTIEVDDKRFDEAQENFSKVDLSSVKIVQHKGEILELLGDNNFLKGLSFDFVFLDAAHKKYREIVEILEQRQLLSDDFCLIADNVISHSYMQEFIDYMDSKYDVHVLKIDSGFLIAQRKK